jgi:hypothetical protein
VATGVLVFFQKMCTENQKLGKTFGSQAFVGVIIIGVIFFKHFDLRNNVFLLPWPNVIVCDAHLSLTTQLLPSHLFRCSPPF